MNTEVHKMFNKQRHLSEIYVRLGNGLHGLRFESGHSQNFSRLQNVQTVSGAYSVSCLAGKKVLSPWSWDRVLKLTV
jgi:hypothetical protein